MLTAQSHYPTDQSIGLFGAEEGSTRTMFWGLVSTASSAVSFYHGYKRNDSLAWGLAWGFMGAIFPIITPIYAYVKKPGFAKRA
jgi:hypothetical protein